MRKRFVALMIVVVVGAAPAVAGAQDLPRVKPEAVGMSSERLERITKWLGSEIEQNKAPGAVLLVARHGKVVYFEALGKRDPATGVAMTRDTIFRIYSMSKPITTVVAMMLVEEGKVALGDPIAKYMPQFSKMNVGVEKADAAGGPATLELVPAKASITVQDLMRHSSGFTYGFFGNSLVKKAYLEADLGNPDMTNADLVDRIARLPLAYQPGTTWEYSHSTDVLGRLIEIVSGRTLYQLEKARLLDPLGMPDTSFVVADPAKQARLAEPFKDDRTIGTNAEFNDPRLPRKYESGGGGMVGTAADYARFCQMLLNGGALDGKRILSPRTVAYMTSDHLGSRIVPGPLYLPGDGYGFGLGFAVRREVGVASYQGEAGDYFWGGAGGTYFWVDPRTDMFVVFMMQSPKQRVPYRAVLRNMMYGAVMK
jgi:CubicO group peptidase (beta-lactamase class C family)